MKKRALCIIVTVIMIMSLIPVPGFSQGSIQREFYISPNGSDSNDGTIIAPFATFQKARDEIRLINGNMTGDIVVYAMGGTYHFTEHLELGPGDSGTNGYSIIYRNYEGQSPVISGGREITGWSLHDAAKGIWEADAGDLETRQLYVNGIRATRARSEGGLQGAVMTETGYTTTDTDIQNWGNISDIEFVYTIQWTQSRVGVASISGTTVTMKQPAFDMNQNKVSAYLIPTAPTYIENAYELLDEQGEWYLNRATDKIYYIPRAGENMNNVTVVAPVLETLVEGSGVIGNPVQNIQFEGLTFSYATWLRPNGNEGFADIEANFCSNPGEQNLDLWVQTPGNIEFTYARNVVFERNTFRRLGAGAIHFGIGSQDNVISGNKIFDISSNGIQIGGAGAEDRDPTGTEAEKAEKTVRNNKVSNNYIHNIGVEYKGAVAIWAGYTDGTQIEHNELTALPYTAIVEGWGWGAVSTPTLRNCIIRNNYIHDFMNVLFDGGGIKTMGEQPETFISGNVVSDQHAEYAAIYIDDGSRYITIQDNIMHNNVRNFYAKGSDHIISGNYWDNDYRNWYHQSNSILENNTVVDDGNFPIHIINQAGLEYEYQDLLPQEENRNLACGKPVRVYDGTGSAIEETLVGHPGSNVTDNDLTTFMSTGLDDPCIVEIDMKRIMNAGSIVLNFGAHYAGECSIKTTVNGLDWEDVDTVDIRSGKSIILFEGRHARNIRIYLPTGLNMLDEIEVYEDGMSIPFVPGEEALLHTAGYDDVVYEVVSGSNVLVDENGIVEVLSAGDAMITAAYTGGSRDIGLSVNGFVEKTVELDRDFVVIGKDAQLSLAGVTVDGMKMPVSMGTVTYGVDDMSKVAMDPQTGVIVGLQSGQVTIAATHVLYGTPEVLYRSFDVAAEVLDSIELSSDREVYHISDGTTQLMLKVLLNSKEYAEPGQYEVLYTSDDISVTGVDNTGLVTINGAGISTIYAAVTYAGVTKTAGIKLKVFPEGWTYTNVSHIPQTGNAEYDNGQWHINNVGEDIWGNSDQFTYVYKEIDMQDYPEGVSIIATVNSIQEGVSPSTMTGLMIRESTNLNSKNVNYRIHSTGVGVEDKFVPLTYRLENGGSSDYMTTQSLRLPARIKLTRVGDDIYAHYLSENNLWIRAGAVENIDMSDSFTIGVAHCSHHIIIETETDVEDVVIEDADSFLLADPLSISTTCTILETGDTLSLDVSGAEPGETLQFTSDNESVATVDQNGTVSGLSSGKTVITVKSLVNGVEHPYRNVSVTILVYDEINELGVVNAALNKQAYVFMPDMQTPIDTHVGYPPPNGVDGDESTITIATGNYTWAFAVDLGDLYTVKNMDVVFHSFYYATEYEILGSTDKITWSRLGGITGGTGGTQTFILDTPTAIRYAAVRAVKPDGPGQPGTQMSIAEFRVNAFVISRHTVTFEANGGGAVESQLVDHNSRAVEPQEPTREGYTFVGWYTGSSFISTFDFANTNIVEDITLYAKWEENTFNAALNKQAYAFMPDMQNLIDTHAGYPPPNGVDGSESTITIATGNYTWVFAVDLGDLYAVKSMDVVFHSLYYATEYEILGSTDMTNWARLGGITEGSGEPGTFVLDSPATIRYAAVRAVKPDGPGQPGTQMSVAEFIVNAFAMPRHAMTFEVNGGSEVGIQLVEHNGRAVEPSAPAKEGYTFAGWYADSSFTTPFDFMNMDVVEDITLYAKWEEITVNVALNKQAYAFMPDMQSPIDTHAGYPPPNGVDGDDSTITIATGSYLWAFAVDLADLYLVKSMDVVFHSLYYATDYEILGSTDITTWIKLGETTGGSGEPKTFVLDSPAAIRYAAVRAVKPDGPGQPGTQMSVAEFRVNAFVMPRHAVTFEVNGGSEVGIQLVEHNGRAVEPSAPAKEGYTFAGWYADSSFTTPFDFANTNIVEDITLYAKWDVLLSFTDMVFSLEGIYLTGSSGIIGNTGTNAAVAESVYFAWSAGIEGNLLIGPGADWTEVVISARPDPRDNVTGEISNLPSTREYQMPQFPEFPVLESKGDLTAGWWPEGPHIISESGAYGRINVTNLLTINIGDEDVRITADNLSVTGSGRIVVNRSGAGRLIL